MHRWSNIIIIVRLILSCPIPSYLVLVYSILSCYILSCTVLYYPIMSYSALSYHVLSCPFLSCVLYCPFIYFFFLYTRTHLFFMLCTNFFQYKLHLEIVSFNNFFCFSLRPLMYFLNICNHSRLSSTIVCICVFFSV